MSSSPTNQPPTPFSLLLALRQHLGLFIVCVIAGLVLGGLAYVFTPTVYEAKGTFLIDKLPFGSVGEGQVDAETERQLVQSLILSIPSEGMRKAVAAELGVPDTDLAFTDHDRPVTLSGHSHRANITVTATRNSRLGLVTVESPDPEFAAKVVQAVFEKIQNINKIAGRMAQIQSALKLSQTESQNLAQEQATASDDRIKVEQECQALDAFIAGKHPLDTFPAFAEDATLSNLKTQLILVTSEYDAVAGQSSLGAKLESKRSELAGLREQLSSHLDGLVAGLRSSLDIARQREDSCRSNLVTLEARMTSLENSQAELAKGFGDFTVREQLINKTDDSGVAPESSVIVIVDPAYAIQLPVRPKLAMNLGLGFLFGAALGVGCILLLFQLRPTR